MSEKITIYLIVSTHSRPKAAGPCSRTAERCTAGFNTQPPEGGWAGATGQVTGISCFNTQPPEGGWFPLYYSIVATSKVSTHSRPKAAGTTQTAANKQLLFQHTAARRRLELTLESVVCEAWFQHTAARRRLEYSLAFSHLIG